MAFTTQTNGKFDIKGKRKHSPGKKHSPTSSPGACSPPQAKFLSVTHTSSTANDPLDMTASSSRPKYEAVKVWKPMVTSPPKDIVSPNINLDTKSNSQNTEITFQSHHSMVQQLQLTLESHQESSQKIEVQCPLRQGGPSSEGSRINEMLSPSKWFS